ncbi:MAG: glycosyltransferase family 1 protein [Bacteroidales bacterium]|nr:glycosyltransferase family 1 protein [Bacteroidales bacterium]
MENKHLHIISFNVPWPANYGGVVDVFYRIRTLSEMGVSIHLHCFTYGREKAEVLNSLCKEVIYYKRDTSFIKMFSRKPYIVVSRQSEALVQNLLKDDYPILCEGVHTAALLDDKRLSGRNICLRAHNVEHDYYRLLADSTPWGWKRLFHRMEARRLKRFEPIARKAKAVFVVSEKDYNYFSAYNEQVVLMPSSHESNSVTVAVGRGDYLLYHGNLSVSENLQAVEYLIHNVFSQLPFPCVIAGLNPPASLVKMVRRYPHISLVTNPSDVEMERLVRDAQVNVLLTFQPTGLKLKLLNSLFSGRFCLVNRAMVEGSGLEQACVVADTPEAMLSALQTLWNTSFTEADLSQRKMLLQGKYDNVHNAELLLQTMFPNEQFIDA